MVWLIVAGCIAGFLALFAAIWCGTLWALATFGGWRRLAEACPAPIRPPTSERVYTYQSLRFGPAMGYNRSLNVTVGEEGIRIEVSRLLRPFHPPILVPWECVAAPQPTGVLIRRPAVRISAAGRTVTLYLSNGAEGAVARLHERCAPRRAQAPDDVTTEMPARRPDA